MSEIVVDDNGCPTEMDGPQSKHCPPSPCTFCTGNSSVAKSRDPVTRDPIYMTSWEWCQEMGTCGATVNWDEVFNRDR